MKTIGSKLFVSFLCMAILTISLLWLVQAVFMKDSYLNGRTRSVAAAVQRSAQADGKDLESVQQEQNVNLIMLDHEGLPQSSMPGMAMMGRLVRVIQTMIPDQMDGSVQYISAMTGAGRTALIGYPMKSGGYLIAVFSLADVDGAALVLRSQLWLITVLLLLFSIILAVVLSRMFSRPIKAVTLAARELASGQLEIVLPVKTWDEIGELTVALNELSVQLQNTENLRKELIANVSHELRAPLAVIQGYSETVRDVTWSNDEKRNQQLTIVSEEASRLSRVVKDILDYSKLQAGVDHLVLTELAICPILNNIRHRMEIQAARKNVQIQLNCPDVTIQFDPDKFEQVINNLLNNAISHADPDSAIIIDAAPGQGNIRISVTNSGDTIPQAEQSQIWDRYYRALSVGESQRLGTGLGLAIVKSILEHHHVPFGVISENRKTTFWFDAKLGKLNQSSSFKTFLI